MAGVGGDFHKVKAISLFVLFSLFALHAISSCIHK
jgi:hypothetical protein